MSRWKQDEARPLCMSQEDAEHIWHGESRPFFTRGIPHEGANQRPTDPGGATLDMKNRWRQDEPRPLFMSQEGDTRRDESRPFFTRGSSHEAADQRSTDPRGETLETKKRWKQDEPQPLCMSQEDAEHPRHGESRPFFTRGNPSHEGAEQRPADPGGAAPDMKSPPRGSAPAAAQPQVPIRRGKAAAAGEAARRVHACTAGDFCHAVRFKRVRIQDWAGRLHARPLETGLPLAPADPDAAPPAALDPIPDGVPGSYLDPTAPALLSERHLLPHCQAVLQYEGAAYGVAPSRAHPSNRAGPGERTESAGFAGVPLEAHPSHRALQGGEGAPVVPSEMQHETHRDQPDNGVPSTARRSHRVVYGGERGASDGAGPGGIPPKTQQPRRVLHGSQAEVVPLRTQRPGHRAPHDGQVETRPDGADFGGSTPANRLEPDGMQKKSLHRVGHKTHLDGRLDDGCGFAGWSAPGVPAVPGRRHETDAGVVQESRSRTPRYSNDIAGWHATGRPADASVVSSAPSAAAAQWPMDPAAPAFPSQLSHVSASPGLVDYINATGGGTQHAPD
ncbi:hypothetical protein DIPPA_25166 [Diplonema papillatum]|nr:hypothetical protein DIPPA_25166 [Diplonema papillatum]